ncbi:hypothetical protein [Bacillus salipaludis]|uniref:Uncharacterized protein n=1 Tax=Bacillus salipaludis TaxID=2547811 RepID=A0AA90TSB9_9BACI|nr:hypothetical protein [Bacillus salipaludis]MDQ6595019.1 hypothetical protein [Bacillus salipaludis]MED1471913.1 hypothetical protein [Bacillus salipaludis]
MEGKEKKKRSVEQQVFSEIIKNAYEKGITDRNLTVHKLLKDLETELKNMRVS